MILTVAGDFDRTTILAALDRLIGQVKPAGRLQLPEVPQVKLQFAPAVLYAPKQVNQSVIRLGHLGITKDDPDLYAIRVLDFILGGSFTSRLMMEIRTNQGLAYNVGSHFDLGRRFTGSFTAETETRAEATAKTIGLMTSIIAGIRKEPVTEQELKLAKDSIINSFLFGFTTPASIVTQQARLEFYGYQSDYLDRYRERIAAVTREDILRAARKHLHPDAFKLVVVGDQKGFDKPLATFGSVTTLDLN
jgi:predicted Zn-dependent peptidase